jgi:ubiquinone/menaquinone biosynthesis C-methylase UbiE
MDARLQTRIQRYGWDLAADDYEPLWASQLSGVQHDLLAAAALSPGECVLDVASGTGRVSLQAAQAVGAMGSVLGVDLSARMVDAAQRRSLPNTRFARMDAQQLALPDTQFDVVLCSLGLMYLPDPGRALREMRRVLRPGGRLVLSVWGERARCGWAALFEIVDAEVASEVCPLFFGLGRGDALARLCSETGLKHIRQQRLGTALTYVDGDEACRAAFVGGPVALAWSRLSQEARDRVHARYLDVLAAWRDGAGYRVPAEFVIVTAAVPGRPSGEPAA